MIPTHYPVVITLICASGACKDEALMQSLVSSNTRDVCADGLEFVSCHRERLHRMACETYTRKRNACACCTNLKNAFTKEALSDILNETVHSIHIDCELVRRYESCGIVDR